MGQFGLSWIVVSDKGPLIVSQQFQEFLRMNGIKQVRVTPYNPASKFVAEHLVQSYKRSWTASRNGGMMDNKLQIFF